jgi:hypothetical protein
MPRALQEEDIKILKKLSPELMEICESSGVPFKSILPPVTHYLENRGFGVQEFKKRLKSLSHDEIKYLVDRVLRFDECLHCADKAYLVEFLKATKIRYPQAHDKLKELVETIY